MARLAAGGGILLDHSVVFAAAQDSGVSERAGVATVSGLAIWASWWDRPRSDSVGMTSLRVGLFLLVH